MDGETIPYADPMWGVPYVNADGTDSKRTHGEHNRFSNGCRWPGDYNSDPREVAGCQCELEMRVSPKRNIEVLEAMTLDDFMELEWANALTGR